MTPGSNAAFREVTEADRAGCAAFSCRGYGQPWATAVEEFIREDLVDVVVGGYCDALALVQGDRLAGIVTWMVRVGPPLIFEVGHLATDVQFRHRGVATALKSEVIERARLAGAAAAASEVHRDNDAMQSLNEKLGAVGRLQPDGEFLTYTVRLR